MVLRLVTRRFLALAAATSLAGFALGVRVSAIGLPDASGKPDLTGAWQLNHDQSDDAQKKLKGGRTGTWTTPRAGTGGGGMGGVHGGFGGVGAMGRPYEQDSPALREGMSAIAEAPEKLTIVYRDADVVFTSGEGVVWTLRATGDTVTEKTAGGHDAERTTKWDGSNLVTELKMSGGVKLIQTYTRISEGRQLVVTSRLEGPGRVIDIRRVYDAIADEVPKTID
jgi:hypothetical protein